MVVYGAKVSYFTGKFETYLRYKEIPYSYRALDLWHYYRVVPRHLGATQYPSVRLDDGRWMSDTTPMIAWLDGQHPQAPVMPAEPVQRYIALLIEDYADEWLWRPSMYYRWSYPEDRRLAGARLAEEILRLPLPLGARRLLISRRQTKLFVTHDGIDAVTANHAQATVRRLLDVLEPILDGRPFMLGERPTIADIGLMGPFWRHFIHDPTPARIIQDTAPATFAWAARMWNARASRLGERSLLDVVPPDLDPLLREIGETHLTALSANARAHGRNAAIHDFTVQGTTYHAVPTSAYRVWCLEQLRERYDALAPDDAARLRRILERHGCWDPLWAVPALASGHDLAGEAPFCRALRMVRD